MKIFFVISWPFTAFSWSMKCESLLFSWVKQWPLCTMKIPWNLVPFYFHGVNDNCSVPWKFFYESIKQDNKLTKILWTVIAHLPRHRRWNVLFTCISLYKQLKHQSAPHDNNKCFYWTHLGVIFSYKFYIVKMYALH